MRIGTSLALAVLSLSMLHADENWPQFRGPHGDGHADAKGVPIHWSESENIRWKTAIRGRGWSSPVIWGNQIWLTTAPVDGKQKFALCLDRASGKIIHDILLFPEEKPAPLGVDYNSYASPTPALEEGRVYVHFGSPGTACLDMATGKELWQRTDFECNHYRGPASSPVIFGKLLILTFDGYDLNYLVALDKETGQTVWKKDRNIKYVSSNGDLHKAYSTPTLLELDGRPQAISPAADATISYDPRSGEELWRVYHGGMNTASKPVIGHGLIYLTSGSAGNLLALRLGGAGDVSSQVEWKIIKGAPKRASLLLDGELLYMVNDDGIATCVEAKTGKVNWQERVGKEYSASPIMADGHIYFCDDGGKTHVVKPGREFTEVAVNTLDAGCRASPAAVGDAIYLRTKTHLYCIGKK